MVVMHVHISFRLSCWSPNASCSSTITIILKSYHKPQPLVSASALLSSTLLGTPFNNQGTHQCCQPTPLCYHSVPALEEDWYQGYSQVQMPSSLSQIL